MTDKKDEKVVSLPTKDEEKPELFGESLSNILNETKDVLEDSGEQLPTIPERPPALNIKSLNKTRQITEVDTDEVNHYLNLDESDKINEIQRELIRNIRFIDEQLMEIADLTRNYDKYSKPVYEVKSTLISERLKHLTELSKLNKDTANDKKDMESVNDISELLGKKK